MGPLHSLTMPVLFTVLVPALLLLSPRKSVAVGFWSIDEVLGLLQNEFEVTS